MNIKLTYMYRDAGNYKQFGEVIFGNSNSLSINTIKAASKAAAFDELWFNPKKINIQPLHAYVYDSELDHDLHEILDFEETTLSINDRMHRSVSQFLSDMKMTPFF
ncbi:MAG: hypothetical protein AABY68_03515 [Pseudomonadota bacterium]